MNHRKLVQELIYMQCCSKDDLFDQVTHELMHMGIIGEDFNKCIIELERIIGE